MCSRSSAETAKITLANETRCFLLPNSVQFELPRIRLFLVAAMKSPLHVVRRDSTKEFLPTSRRNLESRKAARHVYLGTYVTTRKCIGEKQINAIPTIFDRVSFCLIKSVCTSAASPSKLRVLDFWRGTSGGTVKSGGVLASIRIGVRGCSVAAV